MGLEITTQNLTPSEVPIVTQFFGAPTKLLEGASYFEDELGNTLEVLSNTWGRGWSLCAMTKRGLMPFETSTTSFFQADNARDIKPVGVTTSRAWFEIQLEEGGPWHTGLLQQFPVQQGTDNGHTAALKTFYGRVHGTQHVVYLHLYESARAVIRFEGLIGTSDPSTAETVSRVHAIRMHTPDAVAIFDFAEQRSIKTIDAHTTQLTGADRFMHGQTFPFSGRLVLLERLHDLKELKSAMAQVHGPVVSQVTSRQLWGHVGPFNVRPELHPRTRTLESKLAMEDYQRTLERFLEFRGTHWEFDGPYTGVTTPSRTGSTETFGMQKLLPTLAVPGGFPAHLHMLLPDIYSEAKRPSYFFEENALPFQAINHPDFVALGQGPHFHPSRCKDRLGKPEYYMWTTKPTGNWQEEDWAHSGSSITIGAHSLIAGSALSRQLCLSDTELYKTLDPGEVHFGQARGMGRSLLDLAYAEQAVDDPALREHVVKLLKADPKLGDVSRQEDAVYDVVVYEHDADGDGRKFDGKTPFWMPWSSPGLHGPGLYAAAWMTGDPELVRKEAVAMVRTLALYGIWKNSDGDWEVADAIEYRGGEALTPTEYSDGSKVQTSGRYFHDWIYPCLALYAPLLKGKAKEKALEFCADERAHWEENGPVSSPFTRPVEFFAVPDPRRDSKLFLPA